MNTLSWERDKAGLWAIVDYARLAHITLGRWTDGPRHRAVVHRYPGAVVEAHLGDFDTEALALAEAERRLERCSFCGSRWRCHGGREPWEVVRDRRVVNGREVYSAECEALERARQAAAPVDLDAAWHFAPLDPRATPTGWRVIAPWWAVGLAGHVMLELDPAVRGGPGWWLLRRGGGSAGPMKTWQEAMSA